MLSIKPLGLGSAEEELASISVGASIGHGENSRSSVLQGEVLILELVAVDGLATSSVVVGEVTTLNNKIFLTGIALVRCCRTEGLLSARRCPTCFLGENDLLILCLHVIL